MSAKTAIIAMGRYGDVVNILPCARDIALKEGGQCAVVVSDEFASMLDGCSYVEPIVVSSHFTDVQPAIEQAKQMFERVLVSKVNERSIGVTTQCQSFTAESWRQIGYLNDWFRLPLVFDRRDREREAALIKKQTGGRPFVLYNFGGRSSPVPNGDAWLEKSKHNFKCRNFIDLSRIQAHRIYDLIGLFDAAECLITGDTSTLHLAAASGVPTVNLIQTKPTLWHGSTPRNNSVGEFRYSEFPNPFAPSSLEWRPRTWHVWSDYAMTGDTLRRHNLAKLTWKETGWIPFPIRNSARAVNDPMRSVPFIKDLIAETIKSAGPRDTIVLTNADTVVASEAGLRVKHAIESHGCCYSFRRDFPRIDSPLSTEQIRTGRPYAGADLFAFTVAWWQRNGSSYPDLLLGAEAWDWAFRTLMKTRGCAEFNDLIAHESHENQWEKSENRNTLPSQLHNKRLAAPFLAAHGVAFA